MTKADRLLELQARSCLSAAEVSELTGISIGIVRRAIASGDLAARKIGSRVVIPTAAAMTWVGAA